MELDHFAQHPLAKSCVYFLTSSKTRIGHVKRSDVKMRLARNPQNTTFVFAS
jgi:hypothetical protein